MDYFGFLAGIGTPELFMILVIILVLFGAKLLPKLSHSIGETAYELRKGFAKDKPRVEAVAVKEDGSETAQSTASRAPRL